MKSETTLYLRRVPRRIKDLFKATAYRRGDTMENVIVGLMKLYIEAPEKVSVPKLTRDPPLER